MAAEKKHGKLKIFFGYAPGAGKTYAMLKAALEDQKAGIDVAAGLIETHKRADTAALLADLEQIPPREVSSKGSLRKKEFDLDRAIRRSPELILLDDLAHRNETGGRHKKRYQDIEELLRAGIDVYTTINVQHIESLQDVVAAVPGFSVTDRIPDSVIDSAAQVEWIDIEPSDLIERFNRGKIYQEEDDRMAYAGMFIQEKLTAMREIALRYTALQLNRMAMQISASDPNKEYYAKDHILICLSSAAANKKVIRTAARMADAFQSEFTALYVETPNSRNLTQKSKAELRKNFRLAEQLGAQIATVYGDDIPAQIAEYAKASRVSKIVVGRTHNKKRWFAKANIVDRLTTVAPNMDIYIIPDTQPSFYKSWPQYAHFPELSLADTTKTAAILILCTLIGLWFKYLGFREANIITVYILGVLLNAMITSGRLYSAVSSVVSVLVFNYFFTKPYFSLQAYGSGYPVTFLVMLSASFITSTLTMRVKEQAQKSAQKAYRTEVLLETSRKLQQAKGAEAIINETAHQLMKLLDRTVIIYPVEEKGLAEPLVFSTEETAADLEAYTGVNEQAVADWVYKNNKRAGSTTNTFSAAICLYHAVRAGNRVFAVAAIAMDKKEPLEVFEKSLMIAMLGECALALENELLNEKQKEISIQIQQEQLRANLLRGISHDLRTPLTSISGNAGILMGNSRILSDEQKKSLYTDIYDDSIWLINLVENLLSITRIDNGTLNLNMQGELLEEVIAEALLHIDRNSNEHMIRTVLADELLMAKMDSRLIIQMLINIVDNAIKYTPAGSHITISAERQKDRVRVEVADNGPGITDEAKLKLFDMFYTADNIRGDGRRGLGLGLSLCKSIATAHGGILEVRDHVPQGTVFSFTLQAEEVDVYE